VRVVSPGKYIAAVIPAVDEFLLFRVRSYNRAGDGSIRYGPIPGAETLSAGTIYPGPTNQWTLNANGVKGLENLGGFKSEYIFYVSKNNPNKLFNYEMHITPEVLKNVVFYPEQQIQSTFQNVSMSPIDDIGTFSGSIEILQLANCMVGFQTYNPLNVDVYTNIKIDYVAYDVKLVKSLEEAKEAVYSGRVVPKVLPVYNESEYFMRSVVREVYEGATFDAEMLGSIFFEEKEKKEAFILNLYGETDGTNTTGTFNLVSDAFSGETEALAIPKGAKVKIWGLEVDGEPCTVAVNVIRGLGSTSPTTTTIKTVTLASPGTVSKEYISRPIVIDAAQSDESPVALAFEWTQETAAKSTVSAKVEFTW